MRRIGLSKAHHMTLMTQPISDKQAQAWGLVDACEADSDNLLRKYLLHLGRLSKQSIDRYKTHMNSLSDILTASKPQALATNRAVFFDRGNLQKIARYVETGKLPWE
ncbi:enoyl-CoA hydratase-related protein [Pendulispora albinea]|uniref:Enoyl-CoA hydratase-related protein n=1 Tax=Pendulispora albinea TaxID=2741071 RepID=A0ABZ2MCT9_9BACT